MAIYFRRVVMSACLAVFASAWVSAADPSNSARFVNVQPYVYFTTPYYQPGYYPTNPNYGYRNYYDPSYNSNYTAPYLQSQAYRSYRDSPNAAPDYYMYYRNQLNGQSNSANPR